MKALDARTGGLGELPFVLRDYGSSNRASSQPQRRPAVASADASAAGASAAVASAANSRAPSRAFAKTAPFGEPRVELLDTWRELQVPH
jgi:hypothetical protein